MALQGSPGSGLADVVSSLKGVGQNVGQIVQVLQALVPALAGRTAAPLYPQAPNDATAANLGVPVGGTYVNGSQMMQRQR